MNYEKLRMILVIIITRVEYSKCQTCLDGEYWYNNKCNPCLVAGCKYCNWAYSCTNCKDGTFLYSNHCFNCTTFITNCKTCSSRYSCDACNAGFYLHNHDKCYTCTGICTACTQGHYFNGTACRWCKTPCTSCNSAAKCTACGTGYYLDGTMCLQCTDTCATCESAYKCTSCKPGSYFKVSQCIACTALCTRCSSADTCTACQSGNFLSGTSCTSCFSPCTTCDAATHCTSCDKGHYLSGGQCQRCPLGCSSCSANDMCTSCSPGYDMNNGQCIQCPERCDHCVEADTCKTCSSGYSLMSGQCYECPTNCATCSSDNKCSSCSQIGYYIEQNSCVKCSQNCLQECSDSCKDKHCDKNGRCLECVDGLYGDSCRDQCPVFCAQCHRNTSGCLSCNKGSYLYNNQCKNCKEMCAVCTSTTCTECVVGRWGDNCEKSCTKCKQGTSCRKTNGYCEENCADGKRGSLCTSDCNPKCLSCQRSSSYKCLACVPYRYGYYTQSSYYHCNKQCPQNCLNSTCDDRLGDCTFGCIDGFSGHQCKCPDKCQCDHYGKCTSCKEGFDNIYDNCECTKAKCRTDECTSCKSSEYFVQNSHCCPCSLQVENCEECTSNTGGGFGECTKCKIGFFPSSTIYCSKCSTNCKYNTCDPVTGACTCKVRLWGDKCDKHCDLNCLECDQHNKSCIVCRHGRYLSDCSKPCPQSCKTTNNVLKCSIQDGACIDGCSSMTLYGTRCEQSCSTNCTNQHCDWQTSYCLDGCIDNHYGDTCDYVCSPTCLPSTSKRRCYDTNGTCIDGCVNGYYGEMCEKPCKTNCINMTCEQFSGSCLNGCSDGYKGNDCTRDKAKKNGVTDNVGITTLIVGIVLIASVIIAGVFKIVKNACRFHKNNSTGEMEGQADEASGNVTLSNVANQIDTVNIATECVVYEQMDDDTETTVGGIPSNERSGQAYIYEHLRQSKVDDSSYSGLNANEM